MSTSIISRSILSPMFTAAGEGSTADSSKILANVWADTNYISSDGMTREIALEYLEPGAKEPVGKWAAIDGQTKLGGVFKWDPFMTATDKAGGDITPSNPKLDPWLPENWLQSRAATSEGTAPKLPIPVTRDQFDQVELYASLTGLATFIQGRGFDMEKIIGGSKHGRITAHVNAVPDMNAWFSPQDEELTFGTSDGKWHLAEDDDVPQHESGHFIFYRQMPELLGWQAREAKRPRGGQEGGAIHEGFGDSIAAFKQNDPELSEDFPQAIGEASGKDKGLRTVNNDLTLKQTGTEVHDRGQVYAGFFWSIKKRLEDPNGPYRLTSRQAADVGMDILMSHGGCYKTNAPFPEDFVKAVLAGVKGLADAGRLPQGVTFENLKQDITDEAIKRTMIKKAADVDDYSTTTANAPKSNDDIETLKRSLAAGDKRIVFSVKPDQVTKGASGTREFYQQWARLADGSAAKVLNAGVYIFRDARGNITGYSAKDVVAKLDAVPTQFGLKEAGKTAADALSLAKARTSLELQKATSDLDKTKRTLPMRGVDRAKMLKEAQKRYRIAEAARRRAPMLTTADAQAVVLAGQKDAFYEFKMGLSLYYVNARTGETMTKDDVLWN